MFSLASNTQLSSWRIAVTGTAMMLFTALVAKILMWVRNIPILGWVVRHLNPACLLLDLTKHAPAGGCSGNAFGALQSILIAYILLAVAVIFFGTESFGEAAEYLPVTPLLVNFAVNMLTWYVLQHISKSVTSIQQWDIGVYTSVCMATGAFLVPVTILIIRYIMLRMRSSASADDLRAERQRMIDEADRHTVAHAAAAAAGGASDLSAELRTASSAELTSTGAKAAELAQQAGVASVSKHVQQIRNVLRSKIL